MRKRIGALVLCLLLVTQLAMPPARAEENVYFVAAGGNVLPLSDATMPFWAGGYLYVAADIFTGIVWNTLGISHAASKNGVILYSRDNRPLLFDLSRNFAQDNDGNTYYPGAVERNGEIFVPASVVAAFFGLQYSLIPGVAHGYLVWLRKPGFGLTDKEFANAAAYSMAECYAQYQKGQTGTPAPQPPDETGAQAPAETGKKRIKEFANAAAYSMAECYAQYQKGQTGTPAPQPPDETGAQAPAETGKKRIYLCFRAGDGTAALLDELERSGACATFFCTQEFLERQGDLLRRMCAEGHGIGLLADGGVEGSSVEEQLAEGNWALYRAACTKTRLALVENSSAAEVEGFRCLMPDLEVWDLTGASGAATLFREVSARPDGAAVWLDGQVKAAGLRSFLAAADRAEDRLLPWTETA